MSQTTAPLPDSDALEAELARLRAEVEALRARAEAAEAAADHDVLTPALNRRGFVTALHRAMAYCKRHQVPAVLLYLDLDGFKGVNNTYGHAAGDAALVRVAELMRDLAEVVTTVTNADKDNEISTRELRDIQAKWAELVGAGQALLQRTSLMRVEFGPLFFLYMNYCPRVRLWL